MQDTFANIDPLTAEGITVSLFSDSSPNFGQIELVETGTNTDIFVGGIAMDTQPDRLSLLVAPGDTVTAVYGDTAASASIAGLKDISGSTIINGISPYTFTLVNSKTHEIGDIDYRIT